MIEQTTMTGPQYLRDVAMGLRRMGFPISAPSLEQLAAQWEAERDLLYSLLAVIHRDGGHYTGEHGVEKSARDAQHVVHADRAEIEKTSALFSRWRDTLCLFPNLEALVDEIDALLSPSGGAA